MTAPTFCHPEFGCDCDVIIGGLELELAQAKAWIADRLALDVLMPAAGVVRPPAPHAECGSTCTDECMRMTF